MKYVAGRRGLATPWHPDFINHYGFQVLDLRFWGLDFGFWVSDARFWILDFGVRILGFGVLVFKFPTQLTS